MKQIYIILFWLMFASVVILSWIIIYDNTPDTPKSTFKIISTNQLVLIPDTLYSVGDTVELDDGSCDCFTPTKIAPRWGELESNAKAIKVK